MSDIALHWDQSRMSADWDFAIGNLVTGIDIESAVIVSLFSDRLANADYRPTDGTNDRRGWWGDNFRPSPVGSRLWHLDRKSRSAAGQPILLAARDYCREALSWLIEDGIARKIDISTAWVSATALGIQIVITRPDGTVSQPFRYSYAWK